MRRRPPPRRTLIAVVALFGVVALAPTVPEATIAASLADENPAAPPSASLIADPTHEVATERLGGADRYKTSVAISARTVPEPPTPVVYLASGAGFADALAAGPVAAKAGGALLLTRPDRLPSDVAAELARLAPTRVVVAGGPAAVSETVVEQVRVTLGPDVPVERAAGPDRYGTAAALVADVFAPDEDGRISLLFLARYELVGWADGRLSVPPPEPDYPAFDSRYHNPTELLNAVIVAAIWRPDLVDIFSIGTSYQGRDIWAAKVSDNVTVDEPEPEVLVDALHHAREHLTVEQALYLLNVLVGEYEADPTVRRLVDEREVFIVFALNPDGWAFDLGGSPYRGWRKNRQPTAGTSAVGTDPNRNYDYRWGCCGGSSGNPSAWNYRGPAPWSAPETRVMRDFVESRVVEGRQQIRTHVSLHTNGELILYPYGYTKVDVPADMDPVDQRTFVAMARAMARTNGYRPMQSSDLYITDGDQIDWMYARHRIFSFTFELYPTEQVSSHADHEPPDEVIVRETTRNRAALLYLIDLADCPYRAIGASDRCG